MAGWNKPGWPAYRTRKVAIMSPMRQALHWLWHQGHFPEADKDPVIQIASLVSVQGQPKPVVRNVLTLGTCAPIVGAEVMSFVHEGDLLKVLPPALPRTKFICTFQEHERPTV